jgi:hypothetical protein
MRCQSTAFVTLLLLGALLGASSREAAAQGKADGKAHGQGHGQAGHVPPGQAKKVVTVDQAIVATREVLAQHGYQVVRVEIIKGARVVYYRRGNRGRGRGKGPVERLIIRPTPERVVFEAAPPRVLVDINVRLGL